MKKDIRIYLDADYCDHLKAVATENGVSLNQLIVDVVRKKYPMPKKQKPAPSLQSLIDAEATKRQLEEITKHLERAKSGGPKVKPVELYQFLVEEQKRLKALLDNIET